MDALTRRRDAIVVLNQARNRTAPHFSYWPRSRPLLRDRLWPTSSVISIRRARTLSEDSRQDVLFRSLDPEGATMQSNMAPWAFVLAVPDIDRSAQYFRDVLGFRISWENATDWRLVERDGVRIMLGQCPTDMHPSALGSHNWFGYLEVEDVDSLYGEFTARGAVCTAPKE